MIKNLDERVIKKAIYQDPVSNFLLEERFQLLLARMANINTQDSKHEVMIRFLEPAQFEIIASDTKAWKQFIVELNGPT